MKRVSCSKRITSQESHIIFNGNSQVKQLLITIYFINILEIKLHRIQSKLGNITLIKSKAKYRNAFYSRVQSIFRDESSCFCAFIYQNTAQRLATIMLNFIMIIKSWYKSKNLIVF